VATFVPLLQLRSVLPLSYDFTISKRQSKLCAARGFDLRKWEGLIEEGNALRRDIKAVANEYDVEWDELEDEKDEVSHALKKEREKKRMEMIRSTTRKMTRMMIKCIYTNSG
jgi:hypothetical protein